MSAGLNECDHEVADLVDEAFGLLEAGDVKGAERVWEHASTHAPEHPEVLTLAGCIACERGAFEEALEKFEHAVRVDPTHVVAWIDAAEVHLELLGDPTRCLDVCDRAFPLTEQDPDARMEVLSYRARALMALDREKEAVAALRQTKGLEIGNPDALESVGGVAIALGAWDIAEASLSAALRLEPDHADAHYGMGWVQFEGGDEEAVAKHWIRTLELDLALPRPPWHLNAAEFDEVVENALLELPDRARALLQPVAIVVEDAPATQEVREGLDPRVLGVFCGAPFAEQSAMAAAPHEPNVIKLYQRNLEAACESREELVSEIRTTLLHETAHFFGLEDDDLEQIGLA